MPVDILAEEMKYFEEHRNELLERAAGKFALIKGSECLGTFDTDQNAYQEGMRLFGNTAFLIHEILPEDPIQEIPALCLGLVHAHL
jgi:hypothetical protein